MDQATDVPPPGAQVTPPPSIVAPPPATPPIDPPAVPVVPPATPPVVEEKFDAHGYPIVAPPPEVVPVVETPPVVDPPPAEVPPAVGYATPPATPPVDPPKVDPPPKVEPAKEGDLKVADKGDLEDAEVSEVLAFANKHKLPQSVVDDMISDRKKEVEVWKAGKVTAKENAEKALKERKSGWYEELKADKDFGGEHFLTNVKKVDKLVADFMPNIQKELTKGGGMLPPYIMRDFFKLANHLHKTGKLVEGDPAAEKTKEELKKSEKNAHLDFYKDS